MLQPEKLQSRGGNPPVKSLVFSCFHDYRNLTVDCCCASEEQCKVCFCRMQKTPKKPKKPPGNTWASTPTSKDPTRHFCHGNALPHQISHSFQQGTRAVCNLINLMTEVCCWVKLMRWRMLTSHGFVLFSLSITLKAQQYWTSTTTENVNIFTWFDMKYWSQFVNGQLQCLFLYIEWKPIGQL